MSWIQVPGSKDGSSTVLYGGYRWTLNWQSIENNTSNITVQMYAGVSGSTGLFNLYDNSSYIEYDGGNRYTFATRYDFRNATSNKDYFVGTDTSVFPKGNSYTFTVTHNADGTRTVPVKTFLNGNNPPYFNNITTDSPIILPRIPRASQPTLNFSSRNFEETFTITTNRVSTDFTHTLTYAFGSASGTIGTGVGDSVIWDIPDSLASQIPTENNGVGTITCETYLGSTLIGVKYVQFTLTVPIHWRAVLTNSHTGFSWTNGPNQLSAYIIQNISTLNLTLVANLNSLVSSYGTTITGYAIAFGSYKSGEISYFNSAVSTSAGIITLSGTQYAYYKVKDARGNWSNEVAEQIMGTGSTIYSYRLPANNGFNVARNTTTLTTADFQMNFSVSEIGSPNQNTWKYKRQYWDGSAWVDIDASFIDISTNPFILTIPDTGAPPTRYSESNTYSLRVILTDKFNTVSYEDLLPTSAVPLTLTNKGAGIGKVSSNDVYDLEVGSRGILSDGPVSILEGKDLILTANSTTPTDPGDVVFRNSSGVEIQRLWTQSGNIYTRLADGTGIAIVWTQATDGAGSGLDADLLDNNQGSYYDHRTYNSQTNYLGGGYVSGGLEAPSWFGSGKLKLQMLNGPNIGAPGYWSDVLWVSSYTGSDVKGSNALVFSKSSDNIGFIRQDYDSTTWGTYREIVHSGNIGSQSVNYAASAGNADTVDNIHASSFATIANVYDDSSTYRQYLAKDGSATGYMRTPSNGLIPSTSGGSGSVGTSTWPFSTIYGETFYFNGTSIAPVAAGSASSGFIHYTGSGTATNGKMNSGTNITVDTSRLNYNGYFYAVGLRYGAGGSSSYSDIRLKENILGLDNNFILKLRPVKFNYKNDPKAKLQYGFIAQEVLEVAPDNLSLIKEPYEEDEYYGMEYTQLIAPLVDIVQKQQKQIESLEERLALLESKITNT